MARFVKRGKTWQYEISYKNNEGKFSKIRKGGFKTKTEAKDAATELEYNMKRGLKGDRQNLFLSEYFEDWMRLYKEDNVSPITFRKYEDTLKNIKKYMPTAILSELDRPTYQKYLNRYAKNHVRSTVIKFNNHIRAALKDAVEEGLIPFDPTRKAVIKGKQAIKSKEDKFLDYDTFKKLMNLVEKGINPHYASPMMVVVAGATGMRFAELLGLTWKDIDFETKTIDVNKTWNYKLKEWATTKNESSIRKISIDDHTNKLLKKFKKDQQKLFTQLGISNKESFVFYNLENGLISTNAVTKYLKKKLKELGVEKQFTLHGLRHTHASILLYQGVNIMNVSRRLGHSSIETTMSTYLHIIKELEDKDIELINAVFNDVFKS
ncbi:tyrosine-type recombinase/integrase [Enterococcus avium]|uniref:tyrosine-type recombinase/integrase n=1 Tax=Enterococcus avium TaxID=33945 RepID=UPI001F564F09|nr:tyrosine-type recombinase/integrase [Enterococcus avium]